MKPSLWDYVIHTDADSTHHLAFWSAFEDSLTDKQREDLSKEGDLNSIWTAAVPGKQPLIPMDPSWKLLALKLLKTPGIEGCVLKAYPDPGTGGDPWTIGWSNTTINGKPVVRGDRVTQAQADSMLSNEVQRVGVELSKRIPFWGQMNNRQKAALVSFAYNCGSGFYDASGFETISRNLKQRNWAQVSSSLLLYVNPGAPVEEGLKKRRKMEGQLWSSTPAK